MQADRVNGYALVRTTTYGNGDTHQEILTAADSMANIEDKMREFFVDRSSAARAVDDIRVSGSFFVKVNGVSRLYVVHEIVVILGGGSDD